MPGKIIEKEETSWEHEHRWRPVNALKNASVTIQLRPSWSDKRFVVPERPAGSSSDLASYFDENPDDRVLGSTTLGDLVRRVKKHLPEMYLWHEEGGAALSCGPTRVVFQSEWDGTMVCELLREGPGPGGEDCGPVPRVILEDGREAVVVTIGTPSGTGSTKPTVVQRSLAKGDVYG